MRDIIPKDLHKFIMGEIRTDGWKSQWRQDFEAYRASKQVPPVPVISIPAPVVVPKKKRRPFVKSKYNKKYMSDRRAKAIKDKVCTDCFQNPARKNKTACQGCQDKRTAREMKRYYARKAA